MEQDKRKLTNRGASDDIPSARPQPSQPEIATSPKQAKRFSQQRRSLIRSFQLMADPKTQVS